jgi:hypothetical protein
MDQASHDAIDTRSIFMPKREFLRLDPESYSIVKDRSRTPACSGPAVLEGRLVEGDSTHAEDVKSGVELIGFEPTTSGLQSPRSPS